MSEQWITSWYWTWGRVHGDPPSEPQWIPEDLADPLGRLALDAIARDPVEKVPPFLALSHARIVATTEGLDAVARVDYRVAPAVRFPHGASALGVARRAAEHVASLDRARKLPATRGPFHLSEVLAQAGLAILTARADLLSGESSPRVGTYIALAVTHSGGPLEPMRVGLLDVATSRVVWSVDDALSRAWHAPLAGGELLTLLPPLARAPSPPRPATRRVQLSATQGSEDRRLAPTLEMGSQPGIPQPGGSGSGTPSDE